MQNFVMCESRFEAGWKHLCSLYKSKNSHCLKFGCGKKTLQYWANKHYSKHIDVASSYFYREVLREAVYRGWATETITAAGYRSYRLYT